LFVCLAAFCLLSWLESSLQRSASLGLEVLQRASRRSVDWASTASQNPTMADEDTDIADEVLLSFRNPTELDDAFAKIAEFMAQTTSHCKVSDYVPKHLYVDFQLQTWENKIWILSLLQRFYKSGCCTQPSDIEKNHMSSEDFYIELSPGTYAITASVAESQQQTQLVSVKAGESVNLTFDL
uniref:A-kinase interacting protein 1 n=1 Tax=Pundamilia nyererei TaxID=303518 RepID=A0A3B4FYS3_9CICH